MEDEGDLLGKMITIAIANGISKMPTEKMPQKGLFASEFLLALKEKRFNSHKFPTDTPIFDKKYKHLKSKYKNSFYPFHNLLHYGLAFYFTKPETTKGNINSFLTDLLMAPPTKKLCYKNANE